MAELRVERQESFAGGMNSLAAPTEFRADELSYLLNGLLTQGGVTLTPRPGSKRTHATALNSGAQGWGGIEFTTAAGAQQLVVFVGDAMYYSTDQGASWTSGASSLGTDYWDLAQMRVGSANYLICANGTTNVYYWDGSTWGTLTGAPTGVKYVAVFNGRLYVSGHDAEAVAASAVGNPNSWTTPSAFDVLAHTHDGSNEVVGLFTLGTALLVFKRKSTNYIDGFGYETIQVASDARGISRSVGCMGFRTIQAVGAQAVCWLSERGIEYYQLGGQIQLLTGRLQPTLDSLSWDEIISSPGICHGMYLQRENEYRCAVARTGTTTDLVIGVRPPRAEDSMPIALWLEDHPDGSVSAAQDTVYVDSNGYLAFQSGPTESLVTIDANGYLTVPANGAEYVTLSSGYLSLAGASGAQHAVFFTADVADDDEASRPFAIGYDGYVRRMKVGTKDDVASDGTEGIDVSMTLRFRPMLFDDQFRPKKGRILRVATKQAESGDLLVRLYGDGMAGDQKTVAIAPTTGSPKTTRVAFSQKANALVAELQTTAPVEVTGVELAAAMLRTRW